MQWKTEGIKFQILETYDVFYNVKDKKAIFFLIQNYTLVYFP